jgi:hypothetical protein
LKKVLSLIICLLFTTLYFFNESRTEQFRLQDILSELPSAQTDEGRAVPVLQQTFHYLGSGQQCHAFLGEDGKTVLKFFRHNDFSFETFLKRCHIPWQKWYGKFFIRYNPQAVFASSRLAYEELPEESGVFYLHLHRTHKLHGTALLVDASFVSHQVNLDETAFILQHFGELALSRIERQVKQGDISGAIASIEALVEAPMKWRMKGIHVQHPAFRRNMGFYGDRVMLLDAGSLEKLDQPQTAADAVEETKQVTARLRRWLCKYHSELTPYYFRKLEDVSSSAERYSKRSPG